jgi:hypothetical protein
LSVDRPPNFGFVSSCIAVKRVTWFKTRARLDRWQEEQTLVKHEMRWFYNYCEHQCDLWARRASQHLAKERFANAAYAERQTKVWTKLKAEAELKFAGRMSEH